MVYTRPQRGFYILQLRALSMDYDVVLRVWARAATKLGVLGTSGHGDVTVLVLGISKMGSK